MTTMPHSAWSTRARTVTTSLTLLSLHLWRTVPMLTAEGCRNRRAKLWTLVNPQPDCVLLGEPRHLTYLASFYASPFTYRSQNAPALAILTPEHAVLVADSTQRLYSQAAHVDEIIAPTWYRGRESAVDRGALLTTTVVEQLSRVRGRRIAVDSAVPTGVMDHLRRDGRAVEPLDIRPTIRRMERQKDADEVELMRRSVAAGEAGFRAAVEQIRPGMTEIQAYTLIQRASVESAGHAVLVYGDFVSGERTLRHGGPAGQRIIEPDDLFLLDFSVVVHGYRADFANTFVVAGGRPSARQQELAAYCLEAMHVGESLLQAGSRCRDIDAAVREAFAKRQVDQHFTHHTGHGLGLGHPDPPYLTPESSETLVAGDIVTLEPGLYVDGVGGMRFEHNYLITQEGFQTLTHHTLGLTAMP
ncbi:MAG: M24 family metallopeptidase [Luteitalea sp.]|nr:M24 family metallopeptidase [Luteitalea sp.]